MQPLLASKTSRPRPFDSWALAAAISFDEALPGTLRRIMCASPLRRQCWFHAVSFLNFSKSKNYSAGLRTLSEPQAWMENQIAEIARILTTRRVREILHALHGPVDGLLGALGKLGDQPLRPTTYKAITSILTERHHKDRAKVLRQLQKIAPWTISVLLALPSRWVRLDLATCLQSSEQVSQFTSAVELIHSLVPSATDEALIQSLNADISLRDWAERWVQQAARFPVSPPVPDGGEFVLLGSARSMHEAAARYRNCLKQKVRECVTGRTAYVEHVPSQIVCELQSLSSDRWLLMSLNAPHNGDVNHNSARMITSKLQAVGVLVPARLVQDVKHAAAATLLNIHDYDGLAGGMMEAGFDMAELDAELDRIANEFGVSGI